MSFVLISPTPGKDPLPEDFVGIPSRPIILKEVPPFPIGNNSLPPRTNLIGFPSAYKDSISATGGPPVITTDPEVGDSPICQSL